MKIKLLSGLALGLCALSSWGHVNVQDVSGARLYDFSVDSIRISQKNIDGLDYQTAKMVGVEGYEGIHYQIGAPELPVIRFEVIANSASDILITERNFKSARSYKVNNLKPVFEAVEKIPGARYMLSKSSSLNITESYSIKELGSVRGQKNFLVTLYPVQFTNNSLNISRSFGVEVKLTKADKTVDKKGLVFVVGNTFKSSPSLAKYVALKMSLGFEVDQIDAGTMDADQIRTEIKALYARKPQLKYAIVVGDAEDVPAKDSTLIAGITDHYYASIDTADYSTDILAPDLKVGRFSVTSEKELAVLVDKYSLYIKGNFTNMSWISHLAFLATDDRYEVAEGTHNYVSDTYTKVKGYTGSFPRANEAGGDKLYAITHKAATADVMKSLLKGRSIVNYSGHGATTYWAGPEIDQDNVRSLNYSSLPFVISNACITGDFRVSESFAETWQRHQWGAVMFWGSMDSTYWDEDDILEKRMYDGIFKDKKIIFGEITHNALTELAKFYGGEGSSAYYWETYHMFGDPSMDLRL